MIKYIELDINVTDIQKQKIIDAVEEGTGVTLRFSYEHLKGKDKLAFTPTQAMHIYKNYSICQCVMKFIKTQLRHNKTTEGDFIQLLPLSATAGRFLASSVPPSLGTGASLGAGSATGSKVVHKIAGSGLYIKKAGMRYKMVSQGEGLYLYQREKASEKELTQKSIEEKIASVAPW